jgi:hypothetical protein
MDEKSVVILYNSSTIIYFKCPATLSTNSQTFVYQNRSNIQIMDYRKAKAKFTPIKASTNDLDKENTQPWYDSSDEPPPWYDSSDEPQPWYDSPELYQ